MLSGWSRPTRNERRSATRPAPSTLIGIHFCGWSHRRNWFQPQKWIPTPEPRGSLPQFERPNRAARSHNSNDRTARLAGPGGPAARCRPDALRVPDSGPGGDPAGDLGHVFARDDLDAFAPLVLAEGTFVGVEQLPAVPAGVLHAGFVQALQQGILTAFDVLAHRT